MTFDRLHFLILGLGLLLVLPACGGGGGGGRDDDDSADDDDDSADDDDDDSVSGDDADGDGVTSEDGDCDDNDPDINPNVDERCDDVDWDCDGTAQPSGLVSMGPTAYDTIQGAIDAASAGAEIRICAGSYTENLEIETDLTLVGPSGSGNTVIEGDGNASVVVIRNAVTVEIAGLQITGGEGSAEAGLPWGDPGDTHGGGILTLGGSLTLTDVLVNENEADHGAGLASYNTTLTLEDTTFEENEADVYGGGLMISGSTGVISATLSEVTVEENSSGERGGGIAAYNVDLALNDSDIEGNEADVSGGGIEMWATQVMGANESEIKGNSANFGGGLTGHLDSSIFGDISVSDNEAGLSGGGAYLTVPFTWTGGVIESNDADYGAGVYLHYHEDEAASIGVDAFTFVDTAIESNYAGVSGGAIFSQVHDLDLENVTFWDNRAISGAGEGGALWVHAAAVTLTSCSITDSYANVGGGIFFQGNGPWGSITSDGTDWGDEAADTDNQPDDVDMGTNSYDYSGIASFTCTGNEAEGTCN